MSRAQIIYLSMILAAALQCGCGSDSIWKCQTFALSVLAGPPAPVSGTNIVALTRLSVSPLFQSRSFTYRTGQNAYEQDPYARFLTSPERDLAEPIRASLRNDGAYGRVIDPGSGLIPSVKVEASVDVLDGDFRVASRPVAEMEIHFIIYDVGQDGPGRVLLDKVFSDQTPLSQRTPAALVAAWDRDLRKIMDELNSEYAKTHSNDR